MLVIDIEASGTNPHKHSIVSLGAIDFDHPDRRFYAECQIWPGAHIMADALAVNGFTEAQITDGTKISEAELVIQFFEWSQEVSERTLVGQNIAFDRGMLEAACARAGHMFDLPYRTLDTHTMCFMHMVKAGIPPRVDRQHRRTDINLNTVLQYCGIPAEPTPHNALTGALCHAEVTARLMYNLALLPEYSSYEIPWLMAEVVQ